MSHVIDVFFFSLPLYHKQKTKIDLQVDIRNQLLIVMIVFFNSDKHYLDVKCSYTNSSCYTLDQGGFIHFTESSIDIMIIISKLFAEQRRYILNLALMLFFKSFHAL